MRPLATSQAFPWPGQNDQSALAEAQKNAQLNAVTGQPTTLWDQAALAEAQRRQREEMAQAQQQGGQQNGLSDMISKLLGGGLGGGMGGGANGTKPQSRGLSSTPSPGGMQSCGSAVADPTALQSLLECSKKHLSVSANSKAALVDVDQKVMFIVDRNTGLVEECAEVSTGKGTGDQKNQTPTGMLITRPHHGARYQSNADGTEADGIGLAGTDRETSVRAAAGVILHKSHGREGTNATAGCVGIANDRFDRIKQLLYGSDSNYKRSAVFIHDKNTREKCGVEGGTYQRGDDPDPNKEWIGR